MINFNSHNYLFQSERNQTYKKCLFHNLSLHFLSVEKNAKWILFILGEFPVEENTIKSRKLYFVRKIVL